MAATTRVIMTLQDRPEYASKPKPLTFPPDAPVLDAVAAMTDKGFGAVIITDPDGRVTGVVTERDIMTRLVHAGRDPQTTRLSDIMTANPRVARKTDDVLEWMRTMSTERFRRLPVVDEDGRIEAIFTQGDFVSYTWPDLIFQAGQMMKASIFQRWHLWLIGGAIVLYTLLMAVVFAIVT